MGKYLRNATPAERLAAYVKKGSPNECWEWSRAKFNHGYGRMTVAHGKYRPAHIVAWEVANGRERPEGMVIRHACDNPLCCNPAHLLIGTQAENIQDKIDRGRQPRGEQWHSAKLTKNQVDEIRSRYATGGVMQKDLAAEYGVSKALISLILKRLRWA